MIEDKTKLAIEVMEAYLKGEIIQYKPVGENRDIFQWCRVSNPPIWNFDKFDYRVEPHYDGDRAKRNLEMLVRAATKESALTFSNKNIEVSKYEAEEMYAYLNAIKSGLLDKYINKE